MTSPKQKQCWNVRKDVYKRQVRIITLEKREVEDIDRLHSFVRKEEKIVGIIGTVKTEVPDIPFISLQDLLSKRGIRCV